jgi:membrane protein implicated in regulation of membrane protease activity
MSDRNSLLLVKAVFALLGVLFLANSAFAYVVPGAGPEFVGYFMSLLTWLGLGFSTLLLWPFYAVMRRFRKRPNPPVSPTPSTTETPAESAQVAK